MPSLLSMRVSACLLLGIPVAAAAEPTQTALLSEMEYLGEMPVVLTVSRLAQPIAEAPGAVTVIDREMIKASGFREIPDLFRLVPGFYVGWYDGTMATVNRGLPDQYSRRMQVLVDGRSIYTPLFGGVEWSDLPLAMDDIERIEVIRGPNAASYGANAFMGIINIITLHPAEVRGAHFSGIYGDKGVGQGTLRYAATNGDLDYRLTVGHREDNGFDQKYDSKRAQFLTVRGDYHLTSADGLQFQFGYNEGERGTGFVDVAQDQPRDVSVESHYEQLRWLRNLDAANEFSVQFYHTYHRSSESVITLPSTGTVAGLPATVYSTTLYSKVVAERFDLEFQHTLSPYNDVRMVWGGGTRLDQITSPLFFNTSNTFGTHIQRLFGTVEWRMRPNLLLNAGAMVENHELTGTDTSPRLALNYNLAPNHTLRVAVSKALRMPVMFEENADYRINLPLSIRYLGINIPGTLNYPLIKSSGGLLPEKIYSQEVGYVAELKDWPVTIDFRLFRDRITDLIGSHGTRVASTFQNNIISLPPFDIQTGSLLNQDSAIQGGTDLQLRFRPDQDTQLIFNHSYSHLTSTDIGNTYSATTPVHNYGLLGMRRLSNDWDGSFGYYRVGGMTALGGGSPLNAYQRLDLHLARRFKAGGARGEFSVVLQNVLDDYNDFRNDNVFDRRGYMNLTLDF